MTEVDEDGNDWTPADFSKVEEGMTVTNTYVPPTDDLLGTKIWMPEDLLDEHKVPVWFQLWRYIGDDPTAAVKVDDPVEINAEPWTYTWANMPTHDANGNAYTYFVTEVDEDGNDWTPEDFSKVEEGMTVTNTYIPPTDAIEAEKVWVGGPSPRPNIWFQLWRTWTRAGTTHHEPVPGAEIKLLADGTLKVHWTNIDLETIIGIPYTFYVKEVDAEGNDFVPENYSKIEAGLKVTNTYVIPTDGVAKANKVWVDGPAPRPTVWFKLYRQIAGGTPEAVPGAEIKELADGTTEVTWTDLEETDFDGNAYTFSVREVDADGNDFTPEHYTKAEDSLTVTNTYVSPKIDVTVTKVWKGGPDVKPTIRLQLYRNGVALGEPVELVHPVTTYTWKDLDKTDSTGKAYEYTVDEVEIPTKYSKSVVGLTITNTFIEPVKPPEVPYTGDASNALLYGILAFSSLAGFGAVAAAKRRKKK